MSKRAHGVGIWDVFQQGRRGRWHWRPVDRPHIYSNSTAPFVTALLLKGCNYWNIVLGQRQVYPNLRGGLASFVMLLPAWSCVAFTQFPICRQPDTFFLNIIFLRYGPPLYLHLIRFVALQNELQNPKHGQSDSGDRLKLKTILNDPQKESLAKMGPSKRSIRDHYKRIVEMIVQR